MDIYREITPLTTSDCFMIFSRHKDNFDFPLHSHNEMEINLILNAKGAQRIVGDHIDVIDDVELVLVGPDTPHGWFTHECKSKTIHEVTIQFHADLFDDDFLKRNQMANIREMFAKSKYGILFPKEIAEPFADKLSTVHGKEGFESVIELISLLHELSQIGRWTTLSDSTFIQNKMSSSSRRIERVFEYMNKNFTEPIALADVAKIANMSEVSFSRYMKTHTGFSFIETLNDIRLGHVTRMLIDTNSTIAEIAFSCGFNNLANFNRIFKNKKGMTPTQFKKIYVRKKKYI